MTDYLVAWTDAYDPDGNWHIEVPIHGQSPKAAAEKVDPEPKSRIRVYPVMTDEYGEPLTYGFGSGPGDEDWVELELSD